MHNSYMYSIVLCNIMTVKVLASEVKVHGDIEFIENNGAGLDGGAMYLTSLGQLVLFAGASITFDRNMGV